MISSKSQSVFFFPQDSYSHPDSHCWRGAGVMLVITLELPAQQRSEAGLLLKRI
jgi:hypothetical protein